MKTLSSILALMLIGNLALGDCKATLKLCDAAVKAQQKVIVDDAQQIENYQAQSQLQRQIIADREAQLASPLHDPVIVAMFTAVIIVVAESLIYAQSHH